MYISYISVNGAYQNLIISSFEGFSCALKKWMKKMTQAKKFEWKMKKNEKCRWDQSAFKFNFIAIHICSAPAVKQYFIPKYLKPFERKRQLWYSFNLVSIS